MQIQRIRINTGILFFYFTIIFFLLSCNKQGPRLVEVKTLDTYPSGSGLACLDGYMYVIGDDAAHLLKTDSQFNATDSIRFFLSAQKRIPKDIKADFESIALIKLNKANALLLPGSGSLAPYRNLCLVIDPATKEKKQYLLDTFYNRIKNEGVRDLNIEGATAIPAGMLLASRGNKSFRGNYLIFASHRFWEKQDSSFIKIVKAGANTDTSFFNGISGLDYSYASDQLFLTVTTENTYDSYADGSIGKSYLWIINDISSKKRLAAINPDRIIDLEKMDSRFKGNKIESVCIAAENRKEKELILVADDDKGGTVLFRMIL